MTLDLPLATASPLLDWLPDETLFSLCSRHHRLWGCGTSWQSAQMMFGGRRAGTHHDLPSAIDEFVLRTEGQLGGAEQLARDRTLLRYYRPFVAEPEVATAVAAMRSHTVAHLKFRLGLLTSRFRANHPLKACTSCMQMDLERDGWVYWRMQHQYPGVWVCPEHREPLMTSTVKSTGVERFLWTLPNVRELDGAWSRADHVSTAALDQLTELSDLTCSLVSHAAGDGWLNPLAVQSTLQTRLSATGSLTGGAGATVADAAAAYLEHCRLLRVAPQLGGLPANLAEAKLQVDRLIRPSRSGTHPLRLLVAIQWLFGNAADFVAAHLGAGQPTVPSQGAQDLGDLARASDPNNASRQALVQFLKAGETATSAATRLGIDVTTAMAWASAAGIQVPRRPKILKDGIRVLLVQELKRGVDKLDAAGRYGISVETVTKILRTEVGLHAAWIAARFDASQQRARTTWRTTFQQHAAAGIKIMRAMEPAAFAWLYRNDRDWLKKNSPQGRATRDGVRNSGIRWDARDETLSRAVQQAALVLALARPGKPLQLWRFYQAVPELKPKLSQLERLPLTRRALETALAKRVDHDGGKLLLDEPRAEA